MSDKQKRAVALGLMLLVAAFVFIYRQFDSRGSSNETVPPPTLPSSPVPPPINDANDAAFPDTTPVSAAVPETPDAVVDDVLMNDADTTALDAEEAGEAQSAQESVQTIDDITNTYEAQPY